MAASSIRALGFIAQNLILLDQKQRNGGKALLKNDTVSNYIESIILVIVKKLHNYQNCTPKVIWNLCVATSKIIDTFNQVNSVVSSQKYSEIDY